MDETTKQLLVEEDELSLQHRRSRSHDLITGTSKWPVIALLLASNIGFALGWAATLLQIAQHNHCRQQPHTVFSEHNHKSYPDQRIAITPSLPERPVQFHWYTAYSSPNDTETDILWSTINTAHGHIAIDHETAAAKNWLPSMPVPGDSTKGLYLLESYHQLHCLKIVRRLFFESQAGEPLSYPVQHARHCFDAFRQFIMCHADNTPLYTLGQHMSGDGQWHMCKNWNALREYATQSSACFRDRVGNETLAEQFGNCGDGSDGMRIDVEALDLSEIVPA